MDTCMPVALLLASFVSFTLTSPLSYPGTSWVLAPHEQDTYSQQQFLPPNQYNPNFIPRYSPSNPVFPPQPPNFNQRPPMYGGFPNNVDFGRRFPIMPNQPVPPFVYVGVPIQPQPPVAPAPPAINNPSSTNGGGSAETPGGSTGSGSQENTVNTAAGSGGEQSSSGAL